MNKLLDFLDDLTLEEVTMVTCGIVLLLVVVFTSIGCVTAPKNPLEVKRENIINCVKDLKQNDVLSQDSFEICRQVYQLYLLPDKGVTK